MKIGIFDSGLGGLVIAKALINRFPGYDYVYLGDTKRVPYGTRSQKAIYEFTQQGIEFLFKHGCGLVIVACNTASSQALRKIQKRLLPKKFPDKKVLGVLIPTAEAVAGDESIKKVGLIATPATVNSRSFERELIKAGYKGSILSEAAPLLVPLIENNSNHLYSTVLNNYLKPLQNRGINGIILGCTHYPIVKKYIKEILGPKVRVFSQDNIVPKKLEDYLARHPEIEGKLSKGRNRIFYVTDTTENAQALTRKWFGPHMDLQICKIDN